MDLVKFIRSEYGDHFTLGVVGRYDVNKPFWRFPNCLSLRTSTSTKLVMFCVEIVLENVQKHGIMTVIPTE